MDYFSRIQCPWGDGFVLSAARWTQIGLPAAPTTATVASVFAGVTGNYTVPATGVADTWIMQKRDASANVYQALATTGAAVDQTTGYWIKRWGTTDSNVAITTNGTATPLVTTNPRCPSTVGCYEITLTAPASGADRANLVSYPLPYPVLWSDVRVEVNSTTAYTPSAASTYIRPWYYLWNGTAYYTQDDSTPGSIGMLQPWQGFWIMVKPASSGQTVKLLIPAIPKVSQAPAPKDSPWLARVLDWFIAPAAAEEPSADLMATSERGQAIGLAAREARRNAEGLKIQQGTNWYVRLIAEEPTEKMIDRANVFGQIDGTKAGYDSHDLPAMAPMGSPYLDVVFPHTDWGTQAGIYNSDYRPILTGKKGADQWRFEVRSDKPRKIVLKWEGPKAVIDRSILVDDATGTEYNLNSARLRNGSLAFTMTQNTHSFTWRYKGR